MLMVDRHEAHDYFFKVNDGGFEQTHLIYYQATDASEPVGGRHMAQLQSLHSYNEMGDEIK
jgi:hypothetical protein